ncbi:hypothetical protein [Helicobacter sp.]|uniref:hypothetical protein n=1 Tax=Helicobacter sp. TaxID=218 RepID=UPI0025BAD3E7|nr:hypothetical protein [Helicobacter sp.]MBR2494554.1 hypothetical protein [Helicobacter sp.]
MPLQILRIHYFHKDMDIDECLFARRAAWDSLIVVIGVQAYFTQFACAWCVILW